MFGSEIHSYTMLMFMCEQTLITHGKQILRHPIPLSISCKDTDLPTHFRIFVRKKSPSVIQRSVSQVPIKQNLAVFSSQNYRLK